MEKDVTKKVRLKEIPELRETKRKVYRMSDGTEQAVFSTTDLHVFDDETQVYQEIDTTLYEDEDGKHYSSDKNGFSAKFSREEDNDELFSIENGMHRVTVSAKKNKKNRNKGVKPNLFKKSSDDKKDTDIIKFPNVEFGADYDYRIVGNGIKEEIVINERSEIYHYPFVIHCENVTAQFDEKNKHLAFLSNETGEEVFFIPAPFMTDANGITSNEVSYVIRKIDDENIHFTVDADSQWINSKERAFPVVIDPQINISGSSNMTIYSWDNGYMHTEAYHKIGMLGCAIQSYSANAVCDTGVSNSMSNAILLSLNSWINGTIACSGDQVWYKFTTEGSGSYTISTQGNLDTMGYLYDANGCLITSNDDCNGRNFSINVNLSANTTYYLMVKAWSSNTGSYTVGVTLQSSSGSSQGGNDTVKGTLLSLNNWVSGSINCPDDELWYTFRATAGSGNYVIGTKGSMDTMGYLYDSNDCLIASNDDNGGLNFKINAYLTGGNTYYLKVRAFSSKTGNYTVGVSTECFDSGSEPIMCYSPQRIYMSFNMPSLPKNPRIKKAELKLYQRDGRADCATNAKIGLYQVNGSIYSGYCNPSYSSNLIDFAEMKTETFSEGSRTCYSFDITSLIDSINKGESSYKRLMLKLLDESVSYENYVELLGSASGKEAPQIVVTYESSYGVNTSYRTHTHELGRFGQGSIDLQCGNLMFESEDFVWSGNRMPVTIKHLYNSALADYQYTANSAIGLNTANFSGMKLGKGFKLNIMQSMVKNSDGEYVYIGENGEETYFKQSNETICCESGHCEYLYKDAESGEMVYNPVESTLTQGDEVYKFENGRLVTITQGKNIMEIIYNGSGQITSVVDGAGREFAFIYSKSFLMSIKAPDDTVISYSYSGDFLNTVTYPDGSYAKITYNSKKPATVTIFDSENNSVYKVEYAFIGDRLYSVKEYGADGSEGMKTVYSYSASSGRTIVQTYELMDDAECADCYETSVKTVYTFDDDGNIVSEYVYSEDTGNIGVEGEESGINPHSGDGGAGVVSNINNLLLGHNFENLNYWYGMDCNCDDVYISGNSNESQIKFGKKALCVETKKQECSENGVYQVTKILPAGEYTFSTYAKVVTDITGEGAKGAYIRVVTTDGTVLAESEHIYEKDSEFIRLTSSFVLETTQSVKVQLLVSGKGTVYFDAPQLENNPYANAYNMLENGNFELGTGWTRNGAYYTSGTRFNMSRSMYITGNVELNRNAYQRVYVKTNRTTRETFTLSGWAKGYGLPNHEDGIKPTFRLRAKIKYYDSYYGEYGTEEYTADFSPCTEEWQLSSVEFAKSKYRTIQYIDIYLDYDHNYGTAYFDDIQLVRSSIETDLSAEDFETEPEEQSAETTVDEAEPENTEDKDFKELTDDYGNALTETTFTDGEFGTIYRAFKFNADTNDIGGDDAGNDLISETDARGNETKYTVNGDTSRNEEVIDRCGNKTAYEYDESGRTTKVTSLKPKCDENGQIITDENGNILYEEIAKVYYSYDAFDNLTQIARGDGLDYVLKYNAFHNLESIGVDGMVDQNGEDIHLINYTYKNGNGRLKEMTYANSDKMTATYNGIGQMIAEKWYNASNELTAHYKYVYDGQGNIVRSIDIKGKKAYNYLYEDGKILQSSESDIELDSNEIITSKTFVCTVRYYYDAEDNLIRKRIKFADGKEHTVLYEQAENDSQVVRFTAGDKTVTSHSKTDSFGRKVFDELQLGAGFLSRQFHYLEGEFTDEHKNNDMLKSTPTTQLISQIVLSGNRTISYEYDEEERITKVTDSVDGITEYTYDALGQLLTEKKDGETVNEMTYDNYGNILIKNGIQYCYDERWKDLLTCYNGQEIVYDAQGNPTEYLGHNLTWEKGRQLKSFDNIAYTYNANGIRTSKTIAGNKHTYILDGAKILKEVWDNGDEILQMLYDNEDNICGITYNETPYFFQKNQQGDIIAITDNTGKEVARYSYDAWGACTIVKDTTASGIATINPFRYRGYYYDKEIGMYYLQSRYYDPVVGRFVNGDEVDSIISNEFNLINLYNYCNNNPINSYDYNGNLSWSTIAKAISYIFDFFVQIAKTAGSMSKEMSGIINKIKRAKTNGASKDWIKELTRKKNDLISPKRLGVGKINAISKAISILTTILPYLSYIKRIKDGIKIFAELIVDLLLEILSITANFIASLICKFIPYFGFLLGWAMGYVIDLIIAKVFNNSRMRRIKNVYSNRVKNSSNYKFWISSIGYSVSKCF